MVELLNQMCSGASFTEMVMVARQADDATITCALIAKALDELSIVPRELMLLLRWLPEQQGQPVQGVVRRAREALSIHGEAKARSAPYLEGIRAGLVS